MSVLAVLKRRRRERPALPVDLDPRRPFVTPEGVDLRLQVGAYTDRLLALILDLAILGGCLLGFTILALLAAWGGSKLGFKADASGRAVLVIWLLGAFVLRVGYFIGFELRARGATPGKRALGLRVIARDGRRLTADAIFARNAMRELEVFLPATFLFARGQGVDGAIIALGAIWTGVFVVFPLFNRDRLRLGDLTAGTMVIKAPKVRLLRDIAESAPQAVGGAAFTEAQLDAYGVKELKVLEQVLRTGDRRTMAAVAARIRKRIAWEGPADIADRSFLNAYYAALRQRLETGLLFGRARRDKHDNGDQAKT
ncbi:MAG TPA: RDD family protein [Phenylobacterium sp.]|uniref:RDD family protein n=1 Tax=Phenylobacterium sp. TaxID=1871053 RepID=UPI002B48B019|nr:RDD family protein [Phenylobacterium sp.]HKR86625.1 RDD family protein [Phenylobacterium sp.]